jgi:hypothetical protein
MRNTKGRRTFDSIARRATEAGLATHLTGVILGTITDILADLNAVAPVVEFPVSYTSGDGNAEFTASRARAARFGAKIDQVPTGTTYRLFCT